MRKQVLVIWIAMMGAGCGRCHLQPPIPGVRLPAAVPSAMPPRESAGIPPTAAPPEKELPSAKREPTPEQTIREQVRIIDGMLRDAYFDYDQYRLRADAVDALREAARLLAKALESRPEARLSIEGHCDERGSSAYNLALGEARAQKVREFLSEAGLPASRIDTVSFGEEQPACAGQNEDCWRKNRRAHLRYSDPDNP